MTFFTDGGHTEFERLMREKPGFDKSPVLPNDVKRDCKSCRWFDGTKGCCRFSVCMKEKLRKQNNR